MTEPTADDGEETPPQPADPFAAPPPGGAAPPAPPMLYGGAPANVQPPYPGSPYGGYPVAMQQQGTNGMAIASMVLGILWVYWIGSILALIFGYVALGQIRQRPQSGRGMAIAGIVLGWVGVGTLLLLILIGITAGSGLFA